MDLKVLNKKILEDIKSLCKGNSRCPGFGMILVGSRDNDQLYAKLKQQACEEVGIAFYLEHLNENTTTEQLLQTIEKLNQQDFIDGIFLQFPLPPQINKTKVTQAIAIEKDIDGLNFAALGYLSMDDSASYYAYPAMAIAVMEILYWLKTDITNSNVLVLGNNELGRHIGLLFLKSQCRCVSICDPTQENLPLLLQQAHVIVVNIATARFLTGQYIRADSIIIDLGQNVVVDPASKRGWKVQGDVDTNSVKAVTPFVTPVPGGIGPIIIGMLLRNTYHRYLQKIKNSKM
jgi:5,10-methylene-tetrahydrofolate dehydrogenase/methenyl tetrahydrofolate cyclohydrolase